ncbi:MAG TPA: hypothetical protein GX527_00745 [Clostridiaceae bacterium]|jgi:preprotein translocase subunit YajC|nr:hypothetical protein [Clostridiaceae bacterium]
MLTYKNCLVKKLMFIFLIMTFLFVMIVPQNVFAKGTEKYNLQGYD